MGVTGRCECPQRGFRGGVPHKVPWVALSAHSVPAGQSQLVPPTLAPAALLDLLGDSPGALPHSPAEPLTATPVPLSVPHPCWAEPLPGSTSNPLAPTSLLLPQPPWRGLCTHEDGPPHAWLLLSDLLSAVATTGDLPTWSQRAGLMPCPPAPPSASLHPDSQARHRRQPAGSPIHRGSPG